MRMSKLYMSFLGNCFTMVSQSTPQHSSLIMHLTQQNIAHDVGTTLLIIGTPILLAPQ